jgi:predicted component of type VI protein secretion system
MVYQRDSKPLLTRLHQSPETVRSAGRLEDILSTMSDSSDGSTRTLDLCIYSKIETVKLTEEQSVIIGRSDAQTGFKPDVDLMSYNARKHGVSREHACIYLRGDCLYLMDLGSNNGTFINGKPVMAHDAQPLQQGDVIRLGLLEILVQIP